MKLKEKEGTNMEKKQKSGILCGFLGHKWDEYLYPKDPAKPKGELFVGKVCLRCGHKIEGKW
jgi:hypothetical protein